MIFAQRWCVVMAEHYGVRQAHNILFLPSAPAPSEAPKWRSVLSSLDGSRILKKLQERLSELHAKSPHASNDDLTSIIDELQSLSRAEWGKLAEANAESAEASAVCRRLAAAELRLNDDELDSAFYLPKPLISDDGVVGGDLAKTARDQLHKWQDKQGFWISAETEGDGSSHHNAKRARKERGRESRMRYPPFEQLAGRLGSREQITLRAFLQEVFWLKRSLPLQHEARMKAIQELQLTKLNGRMQNYKALAEKINTLSLSLITELVPSPHPWSPHARAHTRSESKARRIGVCVYGGEDIGAAMAA